MLRILICAALLMIFTQQSYAQRLSKASPPAPANVAGYHRAHCISLNQGIRICKIEFKPDRGVPVNFIYPQNDSGEVTSLTNIGDFNANRVYPSRYIPTSPERWLKNRRATVVTYGENERRILWLRPISN